MGLPGWRDVEVGGRTGQSGILPTLAASRPRGWIGAAETGTTPCAVKSLTNRRRAGEGKSQD